MHRILRRWAKVHKPANVSKDLGPWPDSARFVSDSVVFFARHVRQRYERQRSPRDEPDAYGTSGSKSGRLLDSWRQQGCCQAGERVRWVHHIAARNEKGDMGQQRPHLSRGVLGSSKQAKAIVSSTAVAPLPSARTTAPSATPRARARVHKLAAMRHWATSAAPPAASGDRRSGSTAPM